MICFSPSKELPERGHETDFVTVVLLEFLITTWNSTNVLKRDLAVPIAVDRFVAVKHCIWCTGETSEAV